MPVQSPGTGTAGWDSARGKWNHVSSDGATCCRGLGSSESTFAPWKWKPGRSFLDGQLKYKGTIYATHSATANPPLHNSAYGATDSLKPKEVQSKNITEIQRHYHRGGATERGLTLLSQILLNNVKSILFHNHIIFTRKHIVKFYSAITWRIMAYNRHLWIRKGEMELLLCWPISVS